MQEQYENKVAFLSLEANYFRHPVLNLAVCS